MSEWSFHEQIAFLLFVFCLGGIFGFVFGHGVEKNES